MTNITDSENRIAELERELKTSNDRYNSITENSPTGIFIVDETAKFIYVNQRLSDILGFTIDELIGMDFIAVVSDKYRDLVSKNYENRRRNLPVPDSYELEVVQKNGEKRRVQVTPHITTDPSGSLLSVGHVLDITAEWNSNRLQQAVFRISEAAIKVNNISDLFESIHSITGSILDTTNFYIALYDESAQLLNFPYYIDEKDQQPEPQKLGSGLSEYIIKTGEPLFVTEQGIYSLADKGEIELVGTPSKLWMGSPLKIEDRIIGVVVVQSYTSDDLYNEKDLELLIYVSEQIAISIRNKMAEEALFIEKSHFEELFQSSPEAIVLVDSQSNIKRVNKEFSNIFGYTSGEAVGKNIDYLITESWQLEEAKSITKQVADGERIRFESVRFRKDGSPVYVSILSSPVVPSNEEMFVYAIYRDITERKLWEEQIRSSEEKYRRLSAQLSESNNMKDLLLDVITHDLKNPAGVISGMADLFDNNSENSDIYRIIKESSDNLLNVIENAATLAKITIGDEIEKENLELKNIIVSIVGEFSKKIKNSELTIDIDLQDNLQVYANPIIAEVFRNYIGNAIKYAFGGKKILINNIADEECIVVAVNDFGNTIPAENRSNVFKRNFRLNEKGVPGSGLGLAIVERIASVHGGTAWVEPNLPQGNSFYLKMPRLTS